MSYTRPYGQEGRAVVLGCPCGQGIQVDIVALVCQLEWERVVQRGDFPEDTPTLFTSASEIGQILMEMGFSKREAKRLIRSQAVEVNGHKVSLGDRLDFPLKLKVGKKKFATVRRVECP